MMNTKKITKIIMMVIPIIILLAINGTPQAWSKQAKLDWYDIEDWETDVCSKWGGRQQAENSATSQPTEAYGDITITMQAKKTKTDTDTLYEVTYLLDAYSTATNYEIKLAHTKTNQEKEITQGKLSPGTGTADYWMQNLKENYNVATIKHDKGLIVIPIIEQK